MRRLLFTVFFFLLFGVAAALVFRGHRAYVVVAIDDWQLRTPLFLACAALVLVVWLASTIARIAVVGLSLPRRLRRRRARRALGTGLLRLSEGRWAQAEEELRQSTADADHTGVNVLYAARAAQARGSISARDRYLAEAARYPEVSELAVTLTRAELQIASAQTEAALASLKRLYRIEPEHPTVLRLYAEQALAAGDDDALRAVCADLYAHGDMSESRVDDYAIVGWRQALADNDHHSELLHSAWRRVPKRLRREPRLVRRFAEGLRRCGDDEQAAAVIRDILRKQWDAPLALLFGNIRSRDAGAQLATVETWLKQYGNAPELLLVAGRLCLRNRLWGRARQYFEAGQDNQSRPDALLELGRLFEEINEREEARRAYRRGLELRVQS